MTNSSLRHPLPMKASLGCKYLWKVFLITESLLTLIPTCSSIALMLVLAFYSPPSDIIIIHRPPSSMYRLISYISYALKGNLGPPNKSKWLSFIFLRFSSVLLIWHYRIKKSMSKIQISNMKDVERRMKCGDLPNI